MRKVFLAGICAWSFFSQSIAQDQQTLNLGDVKALQKSMLHVAKNSNNMKIGVDSYTPIVVPGNKTLKFRMKNFKQESGEDFTLYGNLTDQPKANVYIRFHSGVVSGHILTGNKKQAFSYSVNNKGEAILSTTSPDRILCIEYGKANASTSTTVPAASSEAVPLLQSLPGAQAVVLLDFDGQYVSGTPWNNGNPINAAPSGFSNQTITEIFELVMEDFRPFTINVTTDENVFFAAPANRRMRCIFTPTNTAAPGAGGVAYLNSFTWGNDTPCWVFNGGVKGGGEAGSHEIGHTLGLAHDGRTTPKEEYYSGQGNWAPIMGVGYYKNVSQWSKGEYQYASQTQDDLAMIVGNNGFTYRNDDHGNGITNATTMGLSNGQIVAPNNGLIERNSDIDVFRINSGSGTININVSPSVYHANLDIQLALLDASGNTIASAAPSNALGAGISFAVNQGTYYLSVRNSGSLNPATDGYSNYGSLGIYTITGTVPTQTVSLRNPENPANTTSGVNYKYVEGTWDVLPDFNALASVKSGAVANFDLSVRNRNDEFGFEFTGFINAPADGQYTFYTSSDDGSKLFIGSSQVVNNDGLHGMVEQSGSIGLRAGRHAIRVVFFEKLGGENLQVSWQGPSFVKQAIPNTQLFRIAPGNQIPTVTLTSPAAGAAFTAPATIGLSANASDPDGSVHRVEFYLGANLVATDNTAPYSAFVSNITAGSYSVYARVIDNTGAAVNSSTVNITVNGNTGTCSVAAWSATTVYVAGNRVSYQGTIYEAKWWTQGENPSLSGQWDVWKKIGACNAKYAVNDGAEENVTLEYVKPNPASEQIELAWSNLYNESVKVSIIDLSGKVYMEQIKQTSSSLETAQINISELTAGIYVCVIRGENTNKVFRFVKQ